MKPNLAGDACVECDAVADCLNCESADICSNCDSNLLLQADGMACLPCVTDCLECSA